MRQVHLPDGTPLPALGLGTWRLGEDASARLAEIRTMHAAIAMGYRLIDTAEMYGEGGAEQVVGEAVAAAIHAGDVKREALYMVSKVYPHNASRRGTVAACERSLKRLALDHIDLYLLHWRGKHALQETVAAMQALVAAGKIRQWGVSNFDVDDLQELMAVPSQGEAAAPGCATNQVYYSLSERGPEFSLLPRMREMRMPLMAYSPIDQGALGADETLAAIAKPRGLTAAQVALAWITRQPGVLAIPKAGTLRHLEQNLAAGAIELDAAEQQAIEARFPPPPAQAALGHDLTARSARRTCRKPLPASAWIRLGQGSPAGARRRQLSVAKPGSANARLPTGSTQVGSNTTPLVRMKQP